VFCGFLFSRGVHHVGVDASGDAPANTSGLIVIDTVSDTTAEKATEAATTSACSVGS
jgi:hypothetical protein